MDKKLYNTMKELLAEEGGKQADIKYLGSIEIEEDMPVVGKGKIGKDIFVLTYVAYNGMIIQKYYDEDKICIAGRGLDGELFPSSEKMYDNLDFLGEIDGIDTDNKLSLKDLDNILDQVSDIPGISKSEVLSLSQVELDEAIKNKSASEIDLSEDNNKTLPKQQDVINKDVLETLDTKQEVKLSKKVDDRHSLADKLGLKPSDDLIFVYSDAISNNENTTRFTPLVRHSNGQIERVNSLIQVGGNHSDKNIYETDRTGDRVNKKSVNSSFIIEGSNEILTCRIGQMGTIEVGFGQTDKTSHRDAFTQRLETRDLYHTTLKVRKEFSPNKGEYNATNKMDEIKYHEEHGCYDLSLEEADGDPYTGHIHSDEVVDIILDDEDVGNIIDEFFTRDEIKERFEFMREKNPSLDFEQLVEVTKTELATDAEFMHERNR